MFSLQSSRSGGHKHSRKSERRDKDDKPKDTNNKQDRALPSSYFSFLFVVNELQIVEDGVPPAADIYGNPLPPSTPRGYGQETIGRVWRYRDGVVSLAEGFFWYRPEPGSPGVICAANKFPFLQRTVQHSTFSVFNCWRFLPCLYTDIDVTTVGGMGVDNKLSHLEFYQDHGDSGVTRIRASGGSQRHVVGGRPSWIPALLPETYAAPSSHAQQSTGLGGCLPIIIGLLALTKKPGHTDDVFRNGEWNENRFRGGRSSRAGELALRQPEPTGPVRGVLVQVCCDSLNPDSTIDAITDFEDRGKAIRDERL
ncbi:hypothetical protein CSUB01_04770 [Colletotrichum sublineola]|uniref:Uncharacterized protein n=1 Tax=Colletotrichum sublineola TaxID=1173701 RepID=A0A066XJI8_COLSU|nr:hypothetical protein CSUB01_04770 [Colletotrichum sublineola]